MRWRAQDTLFWFANGGLVGKGRRGEALAWTPAAPGRFQLRVVDQQGRADSRESMWSLCREADVP